MVRKISAQEFVAKYMRAWRAGETVSDLAIDYGHSRTATIYRIYQLRKRGVKLPPLNSGVSGPKPLDIDALNNFIETEQRGKR